MNPRVIIITQGLSRIVEPICNKHNVVGIIESKSRQRPKVLFMLIRYLYQLVKHNKQSLSSFAKKRDIPYFYMKNGSDAALEEWVRMQNSDIIVVHSMSQLLRENIFSIPKYKTINLHTSLLPNYRGPNPLFWIYLNMEKESGATLHYIDKGEDTGDIIYQESYHIELGIRSSEMMDIALGNIGVTLILKALKNYKNLPREKQKKLKINHKRARNIKANEHKDFIDYKNWSVERVWHFLRGTESWLNALDQPKGIFKGQRWTILEYEKGSFENFMVGKIYKSKNKYFLVCKNGIIHLNTTFSLRNLIFYYIHEKH